tara:strand:- start:20264 stop:20764 length:501 start_codon:yes stop_codon:yes gene_type:complete
MPIPDFQTTMEPLLEAVKDGQVNKFNSSIEQLKIHFNISEAERQERISSGKQTIIKSRISLARTYFTKTELRDSPGRYLTQIIQCGLDAVAQTEYAVQVKYLQQFPKFKEIHNAKLKTESIEIDSNGLFSVGFIKKVPIECPLMQEQIAQREVNLTGVIKIYQFSN